MKVELKVYGDDGSIHETTVKDATVQMEADIIEVSPINGYRCFERLPTSKIVIHGESQ